MRYRRVHFRVGENTQLIIVASGVDEQRFQGNPRRRDVGCALIREARDVLYRTFQAEPKALRCFSRGDVRRLVEVAAEFVGG